MGEAWSLPTHHRAIVRTNQGVVVEQVPTPTPVKGEIVVAPWIAGLCGTDIQILRGDRSDPAPILGHEGVGSIVARGLGAPPGLALGMSVIINPTHPVDPSWLLGHNQDGLFQEYVRIPATAIAAGLVLPLPHPIPPLRMPLVEPLAAVQYAFQLLGAILSPKTLMVYGDGVIGHLAVISARAYFGSSLRIFFVHHHREGLAWSQAHGIRCELDLVHQELNHSASLFQGTNVPDAILLATPRTASSACLSHALSIVAPHGCIDLVGGFPEAARLPELPSTVPNEVRATHCCGLPPSVRPLKVTTKSGKPISLIGHRGVASSQLLAAAETLARGILGGAFDPLVTHMLTMQEAADLMERLQKHGSRHINGQRFIKVAINLCTTGAPHTHA